MLSLLRARIKISRLVRDWLFWSEAIAEATGKVLGLCNIYVFGSVIEGRVTGGSDVDVSIVADGLLKDFRVRGNLKAEIEEAAGLPLYQPFEIHLATREEAEANPIYREAINKGMRVEVKPNGCNNFSIKHKFVKRALCLMRF